MKKINTIFLFCLCTSIAFADYVIPFSGKIAHEGVNFNGSAEFNFAIIDEAGSALWSSGEPEDSIAIQVTNGFYTALLGGQGMAPLPQGLFLSEQDLTLRVKVDFGGGTGLQTLTPDHPISPVPIAINAHYAKLAQEAEFAQEANLANSVPAGTITSEMLSSAVRGQLDAVETSINSLNVEVSESMSSPVTRDRLSDQLSSALAPLIGQTVPANSNSEWIYEDDYYIYDVAEDQDGNFFVANDLDWDGFGLTKIDSTGNMIWSRSFLAQNDDWDYQNEPDSIIVTSDGGVLISGRSNAGVIGVKQESGNGALDFWLIKTDSEGTLEWEKSFGGSLGDYNLHSVEVSSGGYLLLGSTLSGVSGDKSEPGFGNSDFWVIKVDSNGNKIWDKTYGGDGTETPVDVFVNDDGSFILAGWSTSSVSGNKSSQSKGSSDVWLVKIDASGNKLWDKSYGGEDGDWLTSIASVPGGGFVLAADSISSVSGDVTQAPIHQAEGSSDAWVFRVDANGNKSWDARFGNQGGLEDEYATPHIKLFDNFIHLMRNSTDNSAPIYNKLSLNGELVEEIVVNTIGYAYEPQFLTISDGFLYYDLWDYSLYKSNLNFDPIYNPSVNPQVGWVTNSMLSSEVQSKLDQTITNGSITMDMLSTEVREALDPSHTGQVDSDDDRGELIHGWISEEYASISSIISNGDGGYVILDDEEGDGLSLRNYEANGTLISSVFLYAQDEDWNFWTSATDVVKATDGGYLIVGGSDAEQIEDKSETGYGLEDYWVAKIDSSGEVAWEKTFGGTSSDAYPKCVQLSGGNFLIAGKSRSPASGNKTAQPLGEADIWAICLDQSGNILWDASFGTEGDDNVRDLVAMPDGSAIIAATVEVTEDFMVDGTGTYESVTHKDAYFINVSSSGSQQWANSVGDFGDEIPTTLIALDDGFIFSASTDSNRTSSTPPYLSPVSSFAPDAWLVRMSSDGATKIWEKRINDVANTVSANPSVSLHEGNLQMVYAVSHAELNTNVLVGLDLDGNVLGEKNLEVDWSWLTHATRPRLVPVEDGYILYDVWDYEYAHFNINLDSLKIYESDVVSFGQKAEVELQGGENAENAIIFSDLGFYLNASPPRFKDFYNHDDYLYLADPDNDPVWRNPDDPDVTLETAEGRTVERYLAGWAYDGGNDDSVEDPYVDRAFLVAKVRLKGIGPFVINHTLLDASAKDTAISDGEEYPFVSYFFDWWMEEDVNALWESSVLKSSILNVAEGLAFTHIIDEHGNTTGLQLISGSTASSVISEGLVASSDDVASVSAVELFSGFADGATLEITLDYSIFNGWVSDGGWWMANREILSGLDGSLEDGYIFSGDQYKPVP